LLLSAWPFKSTDSLAANLGARAEFPDHILALPSCDTGRVDQLALDCLCFNAGTLAGQFIWQNLDFVASQDRYHGDSATLSSAISVHGGDVPVLGPSIFLRVASAVPAAKGLIVDYASKVVDFAKAAGVGRILLGPSVGGTAALHRCANRRLAGVHQK
jgi:hypothetical protein